MLPLRYFIDFFSVNGNFSAFLILILRSNTYFIKRKLHYKLALDTELRPLGPITGMSSYVQQIRCISDVKAYDRILKYICFNTGRTPEKY